MKEFMLLFRHIPSADYNPSPEEMQEGIQQWQNWIGGLAAEGRFVSTNQLTDTGALLKPDLSTTDGPYAEVKEIVGGYLILKSNDQNHAIETAKECPILQMGGTVEIRDFVQLNF